MKKWILLFAAVGALLVVISLLLFFGPEMKNQPNIRAYQARFLLPPAGVVPVASAVPSLSQAEKLLQTPLPATGQNLARGRVYYEYYCLMCHGDSGDGNGPVGQSFVPHPADLRAPELHDLSDADLLDLIFTASGHEPAAWPRSRVEGEAARPNVLRYTVLPEHYRYLTLYIRSLSAAGSPATAPGPKGEE